MNPRSACFRTLQMGPGPKLIFVRVDVGDHLVVGRSSSAAKKVKSADVVYEFFRIVGDRLAGIGSGTGLGVVGH